MMERDELEKRYKQAQLHAMAQAAEMQAQEQPAEDPQQDSEPEKAPTIAQIMLKAAGIKPTPDTHMTPEDRLRRYCGLK